MKFSFVTSLMAAIMLMISVDASTLSTGKVLEDLAHRLLNKKSAERSPVLVISQSLNGSLVKYAMELEGTYLLQKSNEEEDLYETWWRNLSPKPSIIWLMYVDVSGSETALQLSAKRLFVEVSVKYIVLRFDDHFFCETAECFRFLWYELYRIQILTCTHDLKGFTANTLLTPHNIKGLKRGLRKTGGYCFLFATKGLDLAIPSRTRFVGLRGKLWPCRESALHVNKGANETLGLWCSKSKKRKTNIEELWFSGTTRKSSTVVCAKAKCGRILEESCFKEIQKPKISIKYPQKAGAPNILVVMIDPISRPHFAATLPRLAAKLKTRGFTSFPWYSVVGPDSISNQAALYTGHPLRSSNDGKPPIWQRLREEAGYKTFKSQDGCIANNHGHMNSKLETYYDSQLNRFFCTKWERPNCVGGKSAASHLIDYSRLIARNWDRPWAQFLHFIDSQEDTMALAGLLDDPLSNFLDWASKQKNTAIVLVSPNGLDYGSYFNLPDGEAERAMPILHTRFPYRFKLNATANDRITPFDVHRTLLELSGLSMNITENKVIPGISLFAETIRTKDCSEIGIPEEFCDNGSTSIVPEACEVAPMPPALISYWGDIGKNLPFHTCPLKANATSKFDENSHAFTVLADGCKCKTPKADWFSCKKQHEFSLEESEEWALVSCDGYHNGTQRIPDYAKMDVHLRYHRKHHLIKRWKKAEQKTKKLKQNSRKPSIFVLEVDSISERYAKFLVKTKSLLKQLTNNSAFDVFSFKRANVMGSASVDNAIALHAGCIAGYNGGSRQDARTNESSPIYMNLSSWNLRRVRSFKYTYMPWEMWCPVSQDVLEHSAPSDYVKVRPWLFDIAQQNGYVSWTGEDFCSKPFLWSFQNRFTNPRMFDWRFDEFFCELQLMDTKKQCLGGRLRNRLVLDAVEKLWAAYPDVPKYAYLSDSTVHGDNIDDFKERAVKLRKLDILLSGFLKRFLSVENNYNTVILLRSDHGKKAPHTWSDYAEQREHNIPWTNLIVPKHLVAANPATKEKLTKNENRLVTGNDLYKTLLSLIRSDDAGVTPNWAYNLLKEEIPIKRSCMDARIFPDFCGCTNQFTNLMAKNGSPHAPRNGVCNFSDIDRHKWGYDHHFCRYSNKPI